MILLDPDLDTDALPPSQVPTKPAQRTSQVLSRNRRVLSRAQTLPSSAVLARFLKQAQSLAGLAGRVSVLLTTDAALRRLNRQFRKIDQSTDVLSFPAHAEFPSGEQIAGDLAISVPAARRQASEHGHSLSVEIKVLILHGLLHLAGYDHETDSGQMSRRERRLRAQLGLPLGLIERAQRPIAPRPGTRS